MSADLRDELRPWIEAWVGDGSERVEWHSTGRHDGGPVECVLEDLPDGLRVSGPWGDQPAEAQAVPKPAVTSRVLARVRGPDFDRRFVLEDGICVETDPAMTWMIGRTADELRGIFKERGWTASVKRQSG